jgi:hypothetical protein
MLKIFHLKSMKNKQSFRGKSISPKVCSENRKRILKFEE